MQLDRVERPLLQLRKLLKSLPENPAPETVHKLRIRTRRVEAVAAAFEPAAKKESRRLIKVLKPVRKAAGSVRDVDVLTAGLLQLRNRSNSSSVARLIEHLSALRTKNACLLLDTFTEQRKPARRRLKDYSRVIASAAAKKPVRSEGVQTPASAPGKGSAADALISSLAAWPPLTSSNLHEFRLRIKELLYTLQMFSTSGAHFISALTAVKNKIGEWHDWLQLAEVAREVLNPVHDDELLSQIESAGKLKLTRALTVSNALRRRYLHPGGRRSRAS